MQTKLTKRLTTPATIISWHISTIRLYSAIHVGHKIKLHKTTT